MRTYARGDLNYWAVLLGVNGTGKSTRAKERAIALARDGVRVFVHDPDVQFEGAAAYPSTRAWATAAHAAAAAKKPFPMIARFGESPATDVMACACAAAEASGFRTPSLVVFDEGSAVEGAQRHRLGDDFAAVLTRRRNRGVGAIIIGQFPTLMHRSNLTLATEFDLFHLSDEEQLTVLRRRAGVSPAVIARLPTLGIGEYVTVRRGLVVAKNETRAPASKINGGRARVG